jgi:hypothetical protein
MSLELPPCRLLLRLLTILLQAVLACCSGTAWP